jgi:spoIIIJ-associated protein
LTTKKEFFESDLDAALLKAENNIGIRRDSFTYQVVKENFGRPLREPKIGIIVEYDEEYDEQPKKTEENWRDDIPTSVVDPVEKSVYVLDGIFKRMGYNVTIVPVKKEGQVVLTVNFTDQKLDLNRGESREFRGAVQYLINHIFQSGTESETRLIVDIGGTLEERSNQLSELAHELSTKLRTIAKPINIHLMNSQDRRILHLILENDRLVNTSSFGEDRFRIMKIQTKTGFDKETD